MSLPVSHALVKLSTVDQKETAALESIRRPLLAYP